MKSKYHNKFGFTLVEVMFAMGILAIGLLGVIALQGVAIEGNMSAKDVMVSTMLASNAIDHLQSTPWAAPAGVENPILADTSNIVSGGSWGNNPAVFPNGYFPTPGNPFSSLGIPSEGPPSANPATEGDYKYFIGWRIDDDPNNSALKGNCVIPLVSGRINPSCSKAVTVRVQWLEGNIVRYIEVDTIRSSGF